MSKLTLEVKCNLCRTELEIPVTEKDWKKYQEGELIQRCFPYLTPEQRELIISGTCPDCFNKLFGKEEE